MIIHEQDLANGASKSTMTDLNGNPKKVSWNTSNAKERKGDNLKNKSRGPKNEAIGKNKVSKLKSNKRLVF